MSYIRVHYDMSVVALVARAVWLRSHLPCRTLQEPVINENHRKVLAYNTYGDDRDYDGGHGTHVVGSILGSAVPTSFPGFENGTRRYNGMAPDAKVVFFDIQNEAEGRLTIPDSLEEYAASVFLLFYVTTLAVTLHGHMPLVRAYTPTPGAAPPTPTMILRMPSTTLWRLLHLICSFCLLLETKARMALRL